MSISFNDLNGPNVSDDHGNTTLGTLSSQNPNSQTLNNTAVGFGALRDNAGGQHNIAVGLNALANNSASNNVAIGENALYNFLAPSTTQTGTLNVAVGNNAMQSNASGNQNVAVGNQALHNNTTGSYNAVVGNGAAYYNTTGHNNAVMGANALLNNTTGSQNVAIGKEALQMSQVAIGNVAVGHHALKNNATGNGNIGIGNHALNADTAGSNNVGIGSRVSANNTSSCILLGNGAQTVASNEIGVGGINLAAPPSPAPSITGYLPVRMSNSTLSNKLYYVPMYDPSVPLTLPIPEVIVANHSSFSGGNGGVGLLIGFPAGYSAVSSVTIANGTYSVSINGPSTSGYYVYYEDSASGFWNSLSTSTYSNLAQAPTSDASLCAGVVFGTPLTFTYVLTGVSTTVTYTPTPSSTLNIGNGYQFQQYNGASATTSYEGFQWGRNPGGDGSEAWGTQTGSGTQTYSAWTSSGDYQFNSIYKYLYPYSTVSGPGPSPSMTWQVTKTLSSIASGTSCTIGGSGSTDISAPTGVTGTITYSISCDSNMPSITLTGSALTAVWANWGAPANGIQTNAIITATQGTNVAYLNVVITVNSAANTLTWAFSPYTQSSAPTPYAVPAALTFSQTLSTYYTNTPAFTVTNTYANVTITSSTPSVASAVTIGTTTTITPLAVGSTIITATSSATSSTGKTRTLLTIVAPAGPSVVAMYSQMTNPTLISPALDVAPNALPPSQQFIANEFGSDISGIIDYFYLPFVQFGGVSPTTNITFEMKLIKGTTTLVTTTFSLPGNAGTTTYLNGINIPFLSQSTASNNPTINFTFNPLSPTSTNTTITNYDKITISLNTTSTIPGGTWQIKMSGGEMAGTVYGTSTQFVPLTVPTFTPSTLTFPDNIIYNPNTPNLIPFTLVSSNTDTPLTYTITPSAMGTITTVANSGGGPISYRFNAAMPGIATITFSQAASGGFSPGSISGILTVFAAPSITFTSVVNIQMTHAIGGKTVVLNNPQAPAATSTNTNVAITYTLTGVSNIAGTTNPCATITTTGSTQTLNLLGFGSSSPSFTLVASQVATPQTTPPYGPGTKSLAIAIVPGDGPSNPIVLNAIEANTSTTPFELNLNVNASISASMSYMTNINAVVTHFNIPYFSVDTNNASQTVQFSLKVLSGGGGTPNTVESTTIFSITTNSSGTYTSPTGGIIVPLSNITPQPSNGITVVSQTPATTTLYAIMNPPTPFSISTINPAIMVVLAPITVVTYGSFTINVNTNNPSGMLGTLYGYIQLLGPNLTFNPIVTPITWTANKPIPFSPATSNATDSSTITYSSSNTNVATIPTSTANSMTLSATQPTNPTNVITISATRAATAIYSQQTATMNPTTNPNMPICINTYALDSSKNQKMVYYNPQTSSSQIMYNIAANSQNFLITFNVTEQVTLNSLNFVINGGEYGCTPAANFTLRILKTNGSVVSVITQIIFSTTKANYDSSDDGTLREIPFGPLINKPTYVQYFTINGTYNPSFMPGDTVTITLSCSQISYLIVAYDMTQFTGTVVGTSSVTSLPKILYMTSSDTMILTANVSSNTVSIFKQCIITSFNVAGVKPGISTQTFTLTVSGMNAISPVNNQAPYSLMFTFTYAFDDINTFTSFQIPFSYTEYSRLYPSAGSTPKMTAYSISIVNNSLYSPTPPMFNINQTFSCVLASSQNFNVSTLGNLLSGTIYGYEILANPNLGALTLQTPLNNSKIISIAQPSTINSAPTFTYTVSSPATINSNALVLTAVNYATVTITATMSETNQYNNAAVTETVDVIARTQLPPSTYSMTTIMQLQQLYAASADQYVNVFTYGTATPMPVPTLYGYGFFNIGPSDSNYYSGSNISFIIFKYSNGVWNTLRTITIVYKQVANSRDDGSLFIIPFYDMFANGAINLPFTRMPSNMTSLSVVCSDGTDNKVPPTFNLGDTLKFTCSASSPGAAGTVPKDQYNQLAGTVLSTIKSSPDYAIHITYNSYSSRTPWTPTNILNPSFETSIPSTYYTFTENAILTGIFLWPIQGVLANTQFSINLYLSWPNSGPNAYMTILVKANINNAFDNFSKIWFTNAPFTSQASFTVINISIDSTINSSWVNKGLYNANSISTNPWIGSGASAWFTLSGFQNVQSSTYSTVMNNGNIPGVFYGCWC